MQYTFQIDTPVLSIDAYAKRVGQSVHAVRCMMDAGQLPYVKFTEAGKKGKRYVNMVALYKLANESDF